MRSSNFITSLLLGGILVASVATAASTTAPDEAELKQLSQQWMTALEEKDKERLQSLLADDFVLQIPGDSASQYVRRAEWLENANSMDWSNFRYENMAVNVEGDHAIVSFKLFFKVSPNPLTLDSGVIDTWERRGGKWQVTHRYLGESTLKTRMSFVAGMLATALALGLVYLLVRFSKRVRRRAV